MILILLGFLITITADLYTDVTRIKRNLPINHTRGWFLRLPLTVIPVWYTYGITFLAVSILILEGVLYWIIFDLLLNLLRKLPFNYLGQSTASDSLFETFRQQLIVKGILLILSLLVTYYFSQRN